MPAHLFSLANLVALAAWILLIGFPDWKHTPRGILNGVILVLCGFYCLLIINWALTGAPGGFDSLENVMVLFRDPKAVLAGWIHYLAFDLFVGLWITQDARQIGIPRWILVIVQLLTFMFGPIGLGIYLLVKSRYQHY
jgi:hypothetical protein